MFPAFFRSLKLPELVINVFIYKVLIFGLNVAGVITTKIEIKVENKNQESVQNDSILNASNLKACQGL